MAEIDDTLSQEQADAKTQELGVKIFSSQELEERGKQARARRVAGFLHFLGELIKGEDMGMIENLTQEELAKAYAPAINSLFHFAEETGMTHNDIKSIKKNLAGIAYLLESHDNTVERITERLVFNLTGENYLSEVPVQKLQDLVQVTKKQ